MSKLPHFKFTGIVTYAVLLALFLSIFPTLVIQKAYAQELNLIANQSVETPSIADSALPDKWNQGQWGTNTASFQYSNTGQDGTRSLLINMTAYTSGDAKWYFEPVTVSANTKYAYSDYSKSNVSTDLWAQFDDASANHSYAFVGTVPASSTWKQNSFYITTPANVAKVTVFHIISSVGTLETDNFSLTKYNVAPVVTNGIPNNSVEQVDPTKTSFPLGWAHDSWGTNTNTFSYLNTGYNGTSHSVRVAITSYTSGDAKWYFAPQPVTGGKYYVFSDYYKSNVTTSTVAMLVDSNGNTTYKGLSSTVDASNTWKKTSSVILLPLNTVSMTVFHLISSNGSLTTDEYSLLQFTPQGFNQGIVSVNFDDGWSSVYQNALPLLNKYNINTTQYIISSYIGAPEYMTSSQIMEFKNRGDEIGSHTVDHQDLTKLTKQQITAEMKNSKTTLEALFGPIKDFAAPYGTYNANSIAIAKKYYQSYRTTDEGYLFLNDVDFYKIKTQNITNATTVAQVQKWVDEAKANKSWLVLVYHQVDTTGAEYSTSPTDLDNELSYIKNSGLQIATMDQAHNMILPQLQ